MVSAVYLLNPIYAFLSYFGNGPGCYGPCIIPPLSLSTSAGLLVANLALSASVFALAALYFTRRLEV